MPSRWTPHTTVAAIVERAGSGAAPPEFLLVEEDTLDGLRLNHPAGHLERGETPQQAVVREVLEETARVFEPVALVGIYLARVQRPTGEDTTYLRFAYAGRVGEPIAGRALDAGIVRTVWLTADAARAARARHRSPSLLTSLEDHLAGRRFPLELVRADPSIWAPPGG